MTDSCSGADGLTCVSGWLYSGIGGMIFPANKKCPKCNPPLRVEEADPNSMYGQFWVKDATESRAMYTDSDGKDYDIVNMRDALISIKANTKPTAISLSPENRIKAIYEIASEALPND